MPLSVAVLVLLLVPGAVWMVSDWLGADPHEASTLALLTATGAALVLVQFGVRAAEPLSLPLWVHDRRRCCRRVRPPPGPEHHQGGAHRGTGQCRARHCARCGVPLYADHTGHRHYSQPADYLCRPGWWSSDGRRHLITDSVSAAAPRTVTRRPTRPSPVTPGQPVH